MQRFIPPSHLAFYALATVLIVGAFLVWQPSASLPQLASSASAPQIKIVKPPRPGERPDFGAVKAPPQQIGGPIEVIDGDTVRSRGVVYRLVGFDTPEAGRNAKCEGERALAAKATQRMRQLVARGAMLRRVPCACRPGTEGTRACNFGRLCGVLTVGGADVAGTMIREGLARPYHCSGTSCPRRQSWC